MTWADVVAYLDGRYRLDHIAPGVVALSWRFDDDDAYVVQSELVRESVAFGELFVVITSEVAAGDALAATEALHHNATLAIGALVLDDEERYVLRHGILAADLSRPVLDRALELVAHEAARLSHKLRCRVDPAHYRHYAD